LNLAFFHAKQSIGNVIRNMSMKERSKEERSVFQCQLGTMEERDNSWEVNISANPN
jgi:hypothetical protein